MRKLLFSILIFATFSIYIYYEKNIAKGLNSASLSPASKQVKSTPVTVKKSVSPGPEPTPLGKYKDGVYLGPVSNAFYGDLQVKTTIMGGKITAIHFVKYPSSRRTSLEINQVAMPLLIKEAISVQNAEVDGVSGATQTSKAFRESLEGALKNAI